MPILNSLDFVAIQKTAGDPTMVRRRRLASRLEEQKLLFQDPGYVRRTQRIVRENGSSQAVERVQKVRPWWSHDSAGDVVISVYLGSRALEFEKGKAAARVGATERLPEVIDELIAAVRQGELDQLLAQAPKPGATPRARGPRAGVTAAAASSTTPLRRQA
jgi:hypothetical protein